MFFRNAQKWDFRKKIFKLEKNNCKKGQIEIVIRSKKIKPNFLNLFSNFQKNKFFFFFFTKKHPCMC